MMIVGMAIAAECERQGETEWTYDIGRTARAALARASGLVAADGEAEARWAQVNARVNRAGESVPVPVPDGRELTPAGLAINALFERGGAA